MIKQYTKLVKKAKRFTKKRVFITLFVPIVLMVMLFGLFYYFWVKDLPSPTRLSTTTSSYSTRIYDRNGKLLYTLYSDRNQTFVPLNKIPNELQEATISIEDKDFYHHGAVDFRGIARARFANMVHQQFQGGS